ncbi:MAG: acyltransferase domain-containing protein, partial [Candidatus Heimdallarchaeota archaeon]|nr:acyltransferase domain-containing protein [Candidatus Heimdallarchaeota archaeon]
AKEAIEDANLLDDSIDHSRTAVIVGNSMGGEIRIAHTRRIFIPEFLKTIEQTPSFSNVKDSLWSKIRGELEEDYSNRLMAITEDSMPGELSNIIAGRIANTFNLRGKNMTCDAACASSLAALNVAVKGLLDREYDIVLCGGADRSLDPPTFVKFSKIGALSATGSYPFDERASGFVMGEGAGFCILKRLSDAIRDNDKIYAVIRGMGASSDGKGKGITAPNPMGQQLAIDRALQQANVNLSALQYIEAHGTSTRVGDVVEMDVLNNLAKDSNVTSIALGSVKSQIGHLKSAAGIASLIKTALAIYHKTLPPSINFERPNPKVDWSSTPFFVNTQTKDWTKPETGLRMAGVSAFGFGGTNYHVILEEYIPGETKGHMPRIVSPVDIEKLMATIKQDTSSSTRTLQKELVLNEDAWQEYIQSNLVLEMEPIFLGASSPEELLKTIQTLQENIPRSSYLSDGQGLRLRDFAQDLHGSLSKKYRMAIPCKSFSDLSKALELAEDGIKDKAKRRLLRNKGLFYSEDYKVNKIAFLFPGQGSQYVGMLHKLRKKFEIVRATFREADQITKEHLGRELSKIIFADGVDDSQAADLLRKTELTQPAMFIADIALFRLLTSFGIKPDVVAGHSLGEYAALVAAGILSFEDGLIAVIARGKAMTQLGSDDLGMMASIGADYKTTEDVLEQIDGYVIPANKNCNKQTVIAGETEAVAEAIKAFSAREINVIPLPVSAAFHTKLVAPAVEELKKTLEQLTYNKPSIPISSNVTGKFYPETKKEIISLLCQQVTSTVEWITQMEEFYEKEGVTTFIEVGPKRALTSFAKNIFEGKDPEILALAANHPKKGEMQHFYEVIAALGAYHYPVKLPEKNAPFYTTEFLNPLRQFYQEKYIPQKEPLPPASTVDPLTDSPFAALAQGKIKPFIEEPEFQKYLELQAPAISAFLEAGYQTYKDSIASALKNQDLVEKLEINTEAIGVTGVSLGLPGRNRKVFAESNFDDILSGENFIEPIPKEFREKMVEKNIVRLVKDAVKGAQFQSINDVSEVIKLAAQKGEFDLAEEYGVDAGFAEILDATFQLAFAAGIEALRDAGIPLMPLQVNTSVGKKITRGWALPEPLRDETGIVFASAFPAYSNLISTVSDFLSAKFANKNRETIQSLFEELIRQISDKSSRKRIEQWFAKNFKLMTEEQESKYQFSRKFLFEVLSMGHSQFAQFIRARGPNTQVNAACSSTTQALSIAEDWIRNGRCKRVIVVAADDVTNEQMLDWIGAGFLAVGAATTKEKVEEAALPFDKRRHGMIIGMGAVGIVLESTSAMNERGVKPIVDLLGTHIVNSAYHGTRLDRTHIASQVNNFIEKIEKRFNVPREKMAKQMVFVSHETYTPARGGSASAEVDALRNAFGEMTDKIIIANTKGFTGHAMGAGIEDAVAIKILEKGIVPPVANWKEFDPELGHLNLSKGGKYNVKYALRFAAGFGSQLTLALFRLNTKEGRFESVEYDNWLNSLGGSRSSLEVINKTLRMKEDPAIRKQKEQLPVKTRPRVKVASNQIVKAITDLIIEKTGYPPDMVEPDMHLEEDLGIDTVKQAELFGVLRTKYNLPREEGVRIQDFYSVNKIAQYITSRLSPTEKPSASQPASSTPVTNTYGSFEEIRDQITDLIIEKTGYPRDMVEPDMHLEEDLGIDTVKQAELFGKLRTKYALPREEGVRIQDFYSVNKIAQYITSRLSPTEQPRASHLTPAASSSRASQISLEEITKEVIDLIIEKTGYPRDMVEPDMELEEDLGIDTVKQAEMFGIIRNKWNLPREDGISIQDYSTTNKIAKYIQSKIATPSQTPSKVVTPTARTTQEDSVPSRRFTLQLIDASMPKTVKLKLKGKKFLVVGEDNSFTTEIITLLEGKKATIVKFLDLKVHDSRDKILAEIPDTVINGLVYIEPKTTKKNKHNLTARIFFTLCRDINYSDFPLILSINKSTTAFGWTGANNPISGSITGLTKAVARELPNGRVKCVSCVDPKLAIAELCAGDGSTEIAYTKKGKRKVFAAIESPVEVTEQPFTIPKDELVVITGGALGITYQITRELAKKYQPKLALIGIEKLPKNIEKIANYNDERLAQLKEQLISDLKEKHDRVTPVLVEKEWSKITKAIDIRKAIEELTSIGCVAKYYSADVVNSELMQSTFEQIKSDFNQDIIGLIHGAGLEISKLLKDKKPEEFDLVYNVKTIGLDNLLKNTDQKKLQFLVCFSSVAGRFGNGGQVDYAAANDYLSKNCWQLSKKGIRAKAICWSAWAGVGMATRGSIMKVLQQAGVTPIQIEDGVKAFMDELEFGQQPEVVVAGKLGILLESPGPAVTIDRRAYPLVGKIKRNFDGSIIAEKTFSVEENLFLNDHRFDNIPFYPGVMGLELFAELAKVAFPRKTIKKFEDVKFRSAIKFIKDKPRTLKAIISYDKKRPTVVLESQFIKDGVKLGDPTLHFAASLVFGRKKKKVESAPELVKLKVADMQDIYKILPHGSLFQVLNEVNRIDNEIIARGRFTEQQQFSFKYKGFTTTPLVIESAFQTMGLFDIIKDSQMGLPFAIKSLSFYKNSEPPAIIRGYKKGETEFGSIFDFEILTKSGELVLKASDYSTAKVDFGGNFQEVETLRLNRIKQLFDVPKKAKLGAVSIHQLKDQLKQDPSFLETFLHPDELVKYQAFKIEKRQDEWLAGVLAAKKALTKLDASLEPQTIKIEKSELGEPFILLSDSKKPLNLSITHSNGYAIAIVSSSEKIGIDLETITKRDSSIIEEILGPQEQDLLKEQKVEIADELITRIWSAKEAASKVLGVGLNVDLHDITIIDITEDKMKIQIDPRKLPKSVKVPKKAVSKDKSAVGLTVTVTQNEESVGAVCQYSNS